MFAGTRLAEWFTRNHSSKRALFMWKKKLLFAGIVVFVLIMATLVVLIAMTGGLFLMHEL